MKEKPLARASISIGNIWEEKEFRSCKVSEGASQGLMVVMQDILDNCVKGCDKGNTASAKEGIWDDFEGDIDNNGVQQRMLVDVEEGYLNVDEVGLLSAGSGDSDSSSDDGSDCSKSGLKLRLNAEEGFCDAGKMFDMEGC